MSANNTRAPLAWLAVSAESPTYMGIFPKLICKLIMQNSEHIFPSNVIIKDG